MERMQSLYGKKGYPKEWIDKRMRGNAVRQDLTDEWKNRGATTSLEYAILTNEIMQGAGRKSRNYGAAASKSGLAYLKSGGRKAPPLQHRNHKT